MILLKKSISMGMCGIILLTTSLVVGSNVSANYSNESASMGSRNITLDDYEVVNYIPGGEGSSISLNGNIILRGSDIVTDYISHKGGSLIIEAETITAGNINVEGDLKIKGNVTTDFITTDGNLYVYGNVNATSYLDAHVFWTQQCDIIYQGKFCARGKVKITGNLETERYTKNRGYIYGTLKSKNINDDINPVTGFYKKLDPLLKHSLSIVTATEIFNTVNDATVKINGLKSSLESEYKKKNRNNALVSDYKSQIAQIKLDVFSYVLPYLEDETFDLKQFEKVKEVEMGTTYDYLNKFPTGDGTMGYAKQSNAVDNNSSKQSDNGEYKKPTQQSTISLVTNTSLSAKTKKGIDSKIASLPESKKESWILSSIKKTEKQLNNKRLSKKSRAQLEAMIEYLEVKLNELDGNDDVSIDFLEL